MCTFALLAWAARGARGESIDFDRPEAWAMKYFSAIAQPTGLGTPLDLAPGAVEVSLEGGWIPSLSESDRRVGFNGTKVEDLNKTPIFGRVEASVGLPGRLTASIGWVPPIELGGATPELWSLAIGRPLLERPKWNLGLRLHGLAGSVRGDFTCSRDNIAAGDDPRLNPLGCEEISKDRVQMGLAGLELIAGTTSPSNDSHSPRYFGSIGVNELSSRFRVHARYGGMTDRTRLSTSGVIGFATAGVAVPIRHTMRWSTEVYFAPLRVRRPPSVDAGTENLVNVRTALSLRLR